jgi:hypothetical protein
MSPSAGCRGRRQRRRGRWPHAAGKAPWAGVIPNRWRVARKDRWLGPSPVSRTLRACMSMLVNSGWATMLDRHPAARKRGQLQREVRVGRRPKLGLEGRWGAATSLGLGPGWPTSQCVGGRPGSPAAGGSGVRIGIKAVAGEGCAERRAGPSSAAASSMPPPAGRAGRCVRPQRGRPGSRWAASPRAARYARPHWSASARA